MLRAYLHLRHPAAFRHAVYFFFFFPVMRRAAVFAILPAPGDTCRQLLSGCLMRDASMSICSHAALRQHAAMLLPCQMISRVTRDFATAYFAPDMLRLIPMLLLTRYVMLPHYALAHCPLLIDARYYVHISQHFAP